MYDPPITVEAVGSGGHGGHGHSVGHTVTVEITVTVGRPVGGGLIVQMGGRIVVEGEVVNVVVGDDIVKAGAAGNAYPELEKRRITIVVNENFILRVRMMRCLNVAWKSDNVADSLFYSGDFFI